MALPKLGPEVEQVPPCKLRWRWCVVVPNKVDSNARQFMQRVVILDIGTSIVGGLKLIDRFQSRRGVCILFIPETHFEGFLHRPNAVQYFF